MANRDEPDDAELFTAWQGGDREAGAELIDRHFSGVHRFFARRIPDQADDLAQQLFLRVASFDVPLAQGGSLRAYFLRAAHNLLVDLRRRNAVRARGITVLDVPPELPSPSTVERAKEERRLLALALRRLPEDQQLTLELHYWEHLTTSEAAVVLGVAAGTVKWRLSEARKRLAQELERCASDPELAATTAGALERWAKRQRAKRGDD